MNKFEKAAQVSSNDPSIYLRIAYMLFDSARLKLRNDNNELQRANKAFDSFFFYRREKTEIAAAISTAARKAGRPVPDTVVKQPPMDALELRALVDWGRLHTLWAQIDITGHVSGESESLQDILVGQNQFFFFLEDSPS